MNFRYHEREYEDIIKDMIEAITYGEEIQGVDLYDLVEDDETDALNRIYAAHLNGVIDIDSWEYERQYDAWEHRNEE